MESITHVPLLRQGPDGSRPVTDALAVEEPLELRLDGHPISVLMRTPGHDMELAAGFLVTEGIIHAMAQVRKIAPRRDENRVLVFLEDDVEVDLARLTRHLFTGSSCGLCGKATLDAILTHSPRISASLEVPDEVLLSAPDKLRERQAIFETTGGLHAAGLFS
ncbi:MAG: sulfurtransferase FdhD, partial [Verrucomicrobiaceae bacterium]